MEYIRATDSDRLPDGLAGTWERRTPDGRMEATIADGAIEVVRVSGDSREGRLRGEGLGMGGPRGSITDVIIFSTIL